MDEPPDAMDGPARRNAGGEGPDVEQEVSRLRAELERVSVERERFASLVRHNPDLVARFDLDFRHTYVNPAVEAAAGLPADSILGRTNEEIGMPHDLCVLWTPALEEVARTGNERLIEYEFPPGGGGRVFQSRIVAEHDAAGRIASLLGITRDITDARRAEEELRESRRALEDVDEARSRFVATLSHELRTPLNAILGYVELMEKGVPVSPPPEALAYVRRIGHSSRHLLRLIEGILDLSRLEAGRETVDRRPVSLAEVVGGVRGMTEPLAAAAGIEFEVRMPDRPPALDTDPRKLQRILLNLTGNAVKFTEQGCVTLTAEQVGDRVRFEVRDTGIGIPESELERIFEPFHQAGAPPREGDEGAGLGLAVVRELVQLLGGELEVESREGEGTLFAVDVPIGAGA